MSLKPVRNIDPTMEWPRARTIRWVTWPQNPVSIAQRSMHRVVRDPAMKWTRTSMEFKISTSGSFAQSHATDVQALDFKIYTLTDPLQSGSSGSLLVIQMHAKLSMGCHQAFGPGTVGETLSLRRRLTASHISFYEHAWRPQ